MWLKARKTGHFIFYSIFLLISRQKIGKREKSINLQKTMLNQNLMSQKYILNPFDKINQRYSSQTLVILSKI